MPSHWLPVDHPKHTEVLGYRVSTKWGKSNWDQLDWDNWWLNWTDEAHIFSQANSLYFHVECKDKEEGCVYRVRCWYAGGKYRGREVLMVDLGMRSGKLHWIVRTKD
jgi:hypothetical protein